MSFPSNDARRRHELVLTVAADKDRILPFALDEAHVYEVRGIGTGKITAEPYPADQLHNYRIMVELADVTPGRKFSGRRATYFKRYIQDAPKQLGLTTEIEFVGREFESPEGVKERRPSYRARVPADHGFLVSVKDKNGTAESILNLPKATPTFQAPKLELSRVSSRREAIQHTKNLINIGDSLRPYFGSRNFDETKILDLGAAFLKLNMQGFSHDELFALTDSLEHRVHRKFDTKDILTLANSVSFFARQGYSHDDVLRLARVSATIQGPVLIFRGNFKSKAAMIEMTNACIAHAVSSWNRDVSLEKIDDTPSMLEKSGIASLGDFVVPSDLPNGVACIVDIAARTAEFTGVVARRTGSNIPLKAIATASLHVGESLHGISRNLRDFADGLDR